MGLKVGGGKFVLLSGATLGLLFGSSAAVGQTPSKRSSLQSQLDQAMTLINEQRARLDAQAAELAKVKQRLDQSGEQVGSTEPLPKLPQATAPLPAVAAAQGAAPGGGAGPATALQAPLERVGQAPEETDRPIEIAVLDNQGSVVTRKGQLSTDIQLDYARADRSRAVFRGVQLVEAVLVGVFDINESRQDVITESASLRYGLTDRLELGVRVPLVYRADTTIVAPVAGSTNNDPARTIDTSVKGSNIGDVELTARYQLLNGSVGNPYIIANLQGVIPTGSGPFSVPRDTLGRATRVATGAGFYAISPSVTAILPSDPVVLFGTLGYTVNFAKNVNTVIPPVRITYVDPGDAISASAGIGISFNQRTTLNLGYAHSWAFGTKTRTLPSDPGMNGPPAELTTKSRDLQIGRLLFGVTYRMTDRTSLNWSVEVGATDDATDLRTVLRIPIILLAGS